MRALTTTILIGVMTVPAAAQSASERLHELFEARHRWEMREFPERAMSRGDYSNADRITDNSLEAIERRHRETLEYYEQLQTIPREALGEQDVINHELFALMLRRDIEAHRFREFLAPIGARFGPHQSIPQMGERVRFEREEDYENYLARLEQVPQSIDNTIELLETGRAEGRVPPRIVLGTVPGQLTSLLEGGLDRLADPFDRAPDDLGQAKLAELRRRLDEQVLPDVRGAFSKLATYMNQVYIPDCRDSIAATDWPDGKAYYAHRLWVSTTTLLTARDIHEIGLREVARIRSEMMDVIRSSDFMTLYPDASALSDDELFRQFLEYLRTDPRFYHETEEELLDGYRAICKEVDGWLPRFFHTLPRLPYGVKKIPDFMAPGQTTAYYSQGDIRNAEAGFFFANTYKLDQRPKYEMIALAMHEAVPGHHLQVALAQELENVPEFRKELWIVAYGEGWALYSERLGLEMELYNDPYDNFGRLLYEMWRATRLVVDPGMHALGWTRRQAIDFMLANTALSELNITTEVDRYIAWPGQATGYKIGELKIRELRETAEQRLGERFDIRAFHHVLLGAGSVPLDLLEKRVEEWIDRELVQGQAYD